LIQSSNARQFGASQPAKAIERQITLKRKWQFKPRSIGPFLAWGFVLFLSAKILLIPLVEGIYSYVVKTQEINELKVQHRSMYRKIAEMKKQRDYMKTPAYIEIRGHQIGLIKSNESKMVVVDSPEGTEVKKRPKKQVEIRN
jgi:hypothetical protein